MMRFAMWVAVASGVTLAGAGCGRTYEYCVAADECGFGDSCGVVVTDETAGLFCSRVCTSDEDCPARAGFPGRCYDLSGNGESVCHQACEGDFDCAEWSLCFGLTFPDGARDRVCLPDN